MNIDDGNIVMSSSYDICLADGVWHFKKVLVFETFNDEEKRKVYELVALQTTTPLYKVLVQCCMEYLHGYVSDDEVLAFPDAAHLISHLHIADTMPDTKPVGSFSWNGMDVFGQRVIYQGFRSPLDVHVDVIDDWLLSNDIVGPYAYFWYAMLGAWFDVGADDADRLRMNMVPLWIRASWRTVQSILETFPSDQQVWMENRGEPYFALATPYTNPLKPWFMECIPDSVDMMNVIDSMVRGKASVVHRKWAPDVRDAVLPSRGIIRTQQDPRVMPGVIAHKLNAISVPFVLQKPPKEPLLTTSAMLVRKSILCWQSLLYELKRRDITFKDVYERLKWHS